MQIDYIKEMEDVGEVGITKEYIDNELRKMHKKMTELLQVDFPYFKGVTILGESEAKELLTEQIRLNLEEKGVSYTAFQWAQIREGLSGNYTGDFFENMAFYDEKEDILRISQNLLLNHPEKIIPICVHELAEKLISTLIRPLSIKAFRENILEKYTNSKDPNNRISLEEFLSIYKEVVFKSVFKEGLCEAISLKTLLHSDLKDRVASIERELLQGHSNWIGILFDLDNMKKGVENQNNSMFSKKDAGAKLEAERELITRILRSAQIIKSISYHLGYPIAKEIINKHGIEGIKAALKNPPLRAEYFVDPSNYILSLEIKKEKRR